MTGLYDEVRQLAAELAPELELSVRIHDRAYLGNGTKLVLLMQDRDEPLAPEDAEPPDSLGEGGDDLEQKVIGGFLHRWYKGDDLREQVAAALDSGG